MLLWRTLTSRGRWIGGLGLLAAIAGFGWRYPVVGALGLVLLALVLLELVAVLRAPQLTVRRSVSPLVVVRQGPCDGHLTLGGRRRHGLVRAEASEQVDGALVPIDLPARRVGDAVASYPIPTRRRGILKVGPVLVSRSSLSGMAARSSEAGGIVEVRVLPRIVPISAMAIGHRRAVTGGDDSVELGGTDLTGLHEYTMGDDLRRLHWATSARTGTLMVREDADPAEPHICVTLDDRASSYRHRDDFEESVELAAALCRTAAERGNPVRFRNVSGRDEIVVPGSSTRMPRRESRDVEWLLAEIDLVEDEAIATPGTRDLDVIVVISGADADLHALSLALGGARDATVLCVVDPRPDIAAGRDAGALVLRAATSHELARLWDAAAIR